MVKAPSGSMFEYYVYDYNENGLMLGLIFDKVKEKESEPYIALNYISINKGESLLK